jgi:hypothetical protein
MLACNRSNADSANCTFLKLIVVKVATRHCVHPYACAASMRLALGGQLSRLPFLAKPQEEAK